MKGLDNLLLAAPRVLERHANARFLVAGDGDQRQRLIELRDHLGLSDRVHFLGHVEDVPSLLAASDILCHPSLAEGLPNAIVEAMASGVPVVASSVGGVPDVVSHEDTGLLVPPHDIKAIAGSVNRLLGAPDLGARLAANGRRVARERFDLQRNLELLVAQLEQECQGLARAYARKRAVGPRPQQTPIDVLFLMNAIRIGGEETELQILSRHLDRGRFRLHIVSLYPFDDPTAVAALRAESVAIDTRCHAMGDDDKVAHVRAFIRSRKVRVVVACQDTRLAYRVFKGLSAGECSLVEHGGVVEEVSTIPKDRTERYIGVSKAIRAAAAAAMPDPAAAVYLPSMVDTAVYAHLDRGPAPRRLRLCARRLHRHLRRPARSAETNGRPPRSGAPAVAALLPGARACRRRCRCVPTRLRGGASPALRNVGPAHHLRRASRRCSGDSGSVRHPRPARDRRGHVARDQRSRRGRSGGNRDHRRRGAGAARGRRGGTPRAAGASGSPGAVSDRAHRESRNEAGARRASARPCREALQRAQARAQVAEAALRGWPQTGWSHTTC